VAKLIPRLYHASADDIVNGKPQELLAYLLGWLLAIPLIAVGIGFVRNRFVQ
jgi:hypothetical protein